MAAYKAGCRALQTSTLASAVGPISSLRFFMGRMALRPSNTRAERELLQAKPPQAASSTTSTELWQHVLSWQSQSHAVIAYAVSTAWNRFLDIKG